jgi:hypothetical protein
MGFMLVRDHRFVGFLHERGVHVRAMESLVSLHRRHVWVVVAG